MIIPVILSGGAGTRLWPVSREGHPKPFMKLSDGESLLLKTYRRAAAVIGALNAGSGDIVTITNRDYYFVSKDELCAAQLGEQCTGTFLLEPTGRNTAPAVAMAAHLVAEKYGPDALMLVLAADHLIQDLARFKEAVNNAASLAQQGNLVTFGVEPSAPETGFGYIEAGDNLQTGRRIVRFVEKPSQEKAQEYLANGNFFWNSGMFCFQAGVILAQLTQYAPDVASAAQACWNQIMEEQKINNSMLEIPTETFSTLPDISIDYAVMEQSKQAAVIPSNFGWSDLLPDLVRNAFRVCG